MLLQIVNWDELYENHRTRGLKKMEWVPIPNKMDGSGYAELFADRRNGAAHFGVWIALVQIASKCNPRGTLIKATGQPHDIRSLSLMTRIPARTIEAALKRLVELRWIQHIRVVPEITFVHESSLAGARLVHESSSTGSEVTTETCQTVAEYKRDNAVSAPDLRGCTRTRAPALPFRSVPHSSRVEKTTRKTSERFAEFWARWVNGTGSAVGEIQACQAYVSVTCVDEEQSAFACLESYLASDQVARGIVGDCGNWIFKQAANHWRSRWPPCRQKPKSILDEAKEMGDDLNRRIREYEQQRVQPSHRSA